MQVELLDGPLKGQIVDMSFHAAEPLIEQGRARDIRIERPEGIETAMQSPATEKAVLTQPKGRRR